MINRNIQLLEIILLILSIRKMLLILKIRNRITCITYCCTVVIFALLSCEFTQQFVKIKEEVLITALNKKCEKSRGTEVDIMTLSVDGDVSISPQVIEGNWYNISSRYSWRPPEDTRYDGSATNSIILEVPVGMCRSIHFQGGMWRGYVSVKKPNEETEIINTYSEKIMPYSCDIGRSSIERLLLQGISEFCCFTIIFEALSCTFSFIIKRDDVR